MTVAQLRKTIHEGLDKTDDLSLLHTFRSLLDGRSQGLRIALTEAQRNEIAQSKAEGDFVSQREMDDSFKAWLEGK